MRPSARIVSGHEPRRAHFAVRVPSQSTSAPPTASTHAITRTVVIDGPTWLSRNSPSSFVSTRNETRLASVSDAGGGLHLPAFHRLRSVEPVEVQDRRRDVDHVDEAVFARRRGAQQARREPRRLHRDRRERRALLRRRGTHDDDRVTFRVDVAEEAADERVGVAQRLRSQPRALFVGCETTREVGAHEIGPLDEHDGAAGPRLAERVEHLVGIEAEAERRAGVGLEEISVDPPSRHPSLLCHQRRDGTPPVRRHPVLGRARVTAVAVCDHGARDARLRQPVTEQPDLRAVELAVVFVDHIVDRHVHEAVAMRNSRAGREHAPGSVAPEVLVDTEALARSLPGRQSSACPPRTSRSCCRWGSGGRRRWSPTHRLPTRRTADRGWAGRPPEGRTTRRSGARSRGRARPARGSQYPSRRARPPRAR